MQHEEIKAGQVLPFLLVLQVLWTFPSHVREEARSVLRRHGTRAWSALERGSEPIQHGWPRTFTSSLTTRALELVVPGELIVRNSTKLRVQCHHSVSLKSVMVRAFTPWQLAETTNQGSSTPPESWLVSIFQHTAPFISRKKKAQTTGFTFKVFVFLRKRN